MVLKMPQGNTEKNLFDINKQILEIKKKIQLSEGQRKAHYEECDTEKKRNKEKIQQLKKEIKELQVQLAKSEQKTDSILKACRKCSKEVGGLQNKTPDEVKVILDNRATDLKKKLDLLRHQSNKYQEKMKTLADEYHTLLHRTAVQQNKARKEPLEHVEISSLENQINRVEMNLMEAQHIKKKYRSIRNSLLDDSVTFESSLLKLEQDIKKQEAEIKHLQEIHKEALELRDMTKGTLLKQEVNAVNAGKEREKELQELRKQVNERKLELERLERCIFPTAGVRTIVHQESVSSQDGAQSAADDTGKITDFYEDAFSKLKAATGETEPEDVLRRFSSQKKTFARLSYLRNITEEEKNKLQKRKDFMLGELEAFKFAEVKDTEQNQEETERVKQMIQDEVERKQRHEEEIQIVTEQLNDIKNIIYMFCKKLEHISEKPIPPLTADIELIVETLENQIKDTLDLVGYGDEFEKKVQLIKDEKSGKQSDETTSFNQLKPADTKQAMISSETDDEDDVPTRNFLKRQAQIIVDAKSRRKGFPMARGKKTFTLK